MLSVKTGECLYWVYGDLWIDDSENKICPCCYVVNLLRDISYEVCFVAKEESTKHQEPIRHEGSEIKLEAVKHDFSQSWIYFIEGAGKVKIGYSQSPEDRLKDLQVGSPVPLVLFARMRGGPETEAELHSKFRWALSHGEWYYFTDALKTHIESYAEILEDELLIDGQFVKIGV